jgi:hypothetical protein
VALIGWLKQQKLLPRIDAPPKEEKPPVWIEPSFKSGSVVLSRGDGIVRVVWPLDHKDLRRVVAPGSYTIRELRIERMHEGAYWFLSSSGPPYQKVEIAKKGSSSLDISDALACTTDAKLDGRRLVFNFSMHAKRGHGITIFKDGKRVPVTYRVLDKDGKEIVAGKMDYG